MDANQLIKALGNAAAAAKPPQEYCLLWIDWWPMCMTKAEWAAWTQALSIVSIVAAPLFVEWLGRRKVKGVIHQVQWKLRVLMRHADVLREYIEKFDSARRLNEVMPRYVESCRAKLAPLSGGDLAVLDRYDPQVRFFADQCNENLADLERVFKSADPATAQYLSNLPTIALLAAYVGRDAEAAMQRLNRRSVSVIDIAKRLKARCLAWIDTAARWARLRA